MSLPPFRRPLAVACTAAALFAFLLVQLVAGRVGSVDAAVDALLAPLRSAPVLMLFSGITRLGTGNGVVLAALAATALLLRRRQGRLASGLWVALAGAGLTTFAFKHLVGRVRPAFVEGFAASSPSFPSSHATAAMAAYAFLAYAFAQRVRHPGWRTAVWCAATVLIAGVAASRMLLGLHHATDVAAGLLVGVFWVAVGAWFAGAQPRTAARPRTAGDPAGLAPAPATRSPGAGTSDASHTAPPDPDHPAPAGA